MTQTPLWLRLTSIAAALLLNIALWSNWESVLPIWARCCAALLAIASAIAILAIQRKWLNLVTSISFMAASCFFYLLLPLNGESVVAQIRMSTRHLSSMPVLRNSSQSFHDWLTVGELVHARSRFFQSWFRSSANSEFRRSLLLTQQLSSGTSDEIAVYEEWRRTIPGFLQSFDGQDEPVQRMKKILDASQIAKQALSDCQDAVREGDYERLKSTRESLETARVQRYSTSI